MKFIKQLALATSLAACIPLLANANLLVVQAESSGSIGSSLTTQTDSEVTPAVTFVTVAVQELSVGTPGSANQVITYELEFPSAGEYDLYMRLRTGADTYNDDSFYLGNGFGLHAVSDAEAWVTINGLAGLGYTDSLVVVDTAGSDSLHQVWKWIKITGCCNQTGTTFTVPDGELIQDLQIAGREDGLDIDKFVFAPAGSELTVGELDSGQAATTPPPTMVAIADGKEKFLGNIWATSQTPSFLSYWNQVSPENAGKWGSVEGTRDTMNWTQLDAAYNLAKDNDLPFRMHVMIWGNQQPAWIKNLPPEEQLEEIEEWFAAVAERYSGIDSLEVVNEPINDAPDNVRQVQIDDPNSGGYIEALGGEGTTGWDWVIKSFELAREHFPNAELMINEYSVTNSPDRMATYKEIIQLLKDRELIDAVGFQAHAFSTRGTAESILAGVNSLAEMELPIYVTEMDVDGLIFDQQGELIDQGGLTSDQVQLRDYQKIFPIFWEHPSIVGITLWGFRPGLWRQDQEAFLIRANGEERPALVWLRDYVTSDGTSSSSSSSSSLSSSSSAFSSPSINIPDQKKSSGSTNPLLLLSLMMLLAAGRVRKILASR